MNTKPPCDTFGAAPLNLHHITALVRNGNNVCEMMARSRVFLRRTNRIILTK